MWIRSQDKTALVDTKVLTIEKNYDYVRAENGMLAQKWEGYAICSNDIKLGKYSTEEKALKVLDMISKEIEISKVALAFSSNNGVIGPFQMPSDDEVE